MAVLIETSVGDLTIDLHIKEAPEACCSFLKLCEAKYYNNCLFYSVERNFVAKTGDPTGTGRGGECATAQIERLLRRKRDRRQDKEYKDETDIHEVVKELRGIVKEPEIEKPLRYLKDEISMSRKHIVGSVGVDSDKPNSGTSRFYISLSDSMEHMDHKHTIFGQVSEGLEVLLEKINTTIVDEANAPLKPIRIRRVHVLEDPFPSISDQRIIMRSKSPDVIYDKEYETLETAEDEIHLLESASKREAKSRAVVLEMLGDIPDADMRPPENILFICKLNPDTEADDLELICSKYGTVKTCNIVRDFKTGDSLQYGFVEFVDQAAAEQAYFKLQHCVIDDRRVHVDFCQSAPQQWRAFRAMKRRV